MQTQNTEHGTIEPTFTRSPVPALVTVDKANHEQQNTPPSFSLPQFRGKWQRVRVVGGYADGGNHEHSNRLTSYCSIPSGGEAAFQIAAERGRRLVLSPFSTNIMLLRSRHGQKQQTTNDKQRTINQLLLPSVRRHCGFSNCC